MRSRRSSAPRSSSFSSTCGRHTSTGTPCWTGAWTTSSTSRSSWPTSTDSAFERGRTRVTQADRIAHDHPFLDSFSVPLDDKQRYLLERLRGLRTGITEWALHPASAVSSDHGAEVRLSDYHFLMADETRQVIDEENVVVVGYRAVIDRRHRS